MNKIIASLPKSADGRTIYPGMQVYRVVESHHEWIVLPSEVMGVERSRYSRDGIVGLYESCLGEDNATFALLGNARAEMRRRNAVAVWCGQWAAPPAKRRKGGAK